MIDTAPGKENSPRHPEELHDTLRKAYFAIPLSPFYDIESYALDPDGPKKWADRMFDKFNETSEIEPLLHKKFTDVISQAATTDIFKKMVILPWTRVLKIGRNPKQGDPQGPAGYGGMERALYRALGLNHESKTGIFTKTGARTGELALLVWYFTENGRAISELLAAKKDIKDPEVLKENHLYPRLPDSPTLYELSETLWDWHQKFAEHYKGVPEKYGLA